MQIPLARVHTLCMQQEPRSCCRPAPPILSEHDGCCASPPSSSPCSQDGEVPRDVEYERVRRYMVRRCRYAAALIMNVQLPQQDRDPGVCVCQGVALRHGGGL